MNGCWDQLLWIGDVVADKDYAFVLIDEAGVEYTVEQVPKGTWFANPLIFWGVLLDAAGTSWPNAAVTFPTPGTMVLNHGGGAAGWYSVPSTGKMIDEISIPGRDTTDDTVSHTTFMPSFPAMLLDVGSSFHEGHSHRAHTGVPYTMPAIEQATRDVQVQFDYLELGEYEVWRTLWDRRFARGRSCTLFHGHLPHSLEVTLEALGALDQMIGEPSLEVWQGQRTIEYRNVASHDSDPLTYRRRPNIPLSEDGLQAFHFPAFRYF